MVVHSGNGDSGGVEFQIGGQQLIDAGKDGDAVFGFVVGGSGGVWFDDCSERDTKPGGLKLAVDAEMVAAKGTGADDGNFQNGLAHYADAPFPSTALRQRL